MPQLQYSTILESQWEAIHGNWAKLILEIFANVQTYKKYDHKELQLFYRDYTSQRFPQIILNCKIYFQSSFLALSKYFSAQTNSSNSI